MKLKIGKSMESGRELFIAYGDEDAINNHIGFYGKSGMGKTYTLNALAQQCLQRNYACIIIDYSQSYSDKNTRDENIRIIDVDEYQIGIFRVRTSRGERENPFKYASRVSSILQRMFKLGEVQKDFVFQIAKAERESGRELSFETLRSKDLAGKKSEQLKIARKIATWENAPCFYPSKCFMDWNEIISSGETVIISFGDLYSDCDKVFLAELIMLDLLAFCEERGPINNISNENLVNKPFVLCLDEIQRLSFSDHMPLKRFLTEGRKFGANIWASTQSIELLEPDEQILLGQAEIIFEFRPDDKAIKKYRQENDKRHMDLKKLNRGQCLVTARYVRKDGKRTRRASLFVQIEK